MEKKYNKEYLLAISSEDIAKGQQNSCYYCPFALMLKRQFPSAKHVSVGERDAVITFEKVHMTFYFDDSIRRFIRNFDDGKRVIPTVGKTVETVISTIW